MGLFQHLATLKNTFNVELYIRKTYAECEILRIVAAALPIRMAIVLEPGIFKLKREKQ